MKVPWAERAPRTEPVDVAPTTDFGGFHRGSDDVLFERPRDAEDVAKAIAASNADGRAIRFRGHGHSMNGSSLGTGEDRVISSDALCDYAFDEKDTIRVGGGALMWDVHTMLAKKGYQLLVANDGAAPAPSVGGFVSAGGIGENTGTFGGFWETVAEMTVVTGAGEIRTLRPGDELFSWMFGAMGQLAFVVEAKLRIYTMDEQANPYPMGERGTIARTVADWDRYSWFTLFVPFSEAEHAMEQLVALCERHTHCWKPLANYVYPVRFYHFNPKLLYPTQRGFVAEGIWGTPCDGQVFDFEAMQALEHDFMKLTKSSPHYRRYIQTEMTFGKTNYRDYFGQEVFREFWAMKQRHDPAGVLGRGQVFR